MSEFERAVFRVYENTIDGLNFDGIHTNFTTKFVRFMEVLFMTISILSFLVLIFLHGRFVGEDKWNCLPSLLATQQDNFQFINSGLGDNTTNLTYTTSGQGYGHEQGQEGVFFNFSDDYILHLNVYHPDDEIDNLRIVKLNTTTTSEPEFQLQRREPDFEYARTGAVLSLKLEIQKKFEIVNVTIPHKECFGEYPLLGGSIYGLVAYFDGVGTVLMNNLMYTSRSSGVLMKYTGSRARWTSEDIHNIHLDDQNQHKEGGGAAMLFSLNDIMWRKIGILFKSCLAFFLLSTSTAMLIRILLSSGVILLYPILLVMEVGCSMFYILHCCTYLMYHL
jgi:hypothetical protein